MNMWASIVAMLWENWRLTRVEAAWRLAVGMVVASAALSSSADEGASNAFWVLLFMHCMFWMSIAKLNGGRFLDGYKPGFPLYLLYTRPVPTAVFVGVAMAYDAISCTALYLVSAALVGFAFGKPFPLLSVAVWIIAFHLICLSLQWATRNRAVQWLGSMGIAWPLFFLLYKRVTSSLQVEFSTVETALMVLIGVVSFGVTVAGVARQRRGEAVTTAPRTRGSGGYSDWLITLYRFSCPTSSATRAQIWFDLKSSGLPVLALGLAFAMLIALLFAISIPIESARPYAILSTMIAAPAVLIFGGNAFGIRHKQGRKYVSAFEATQPYGTAGLAGLKVLVRSICLLTALLAIGLSVWASSSLMSDWGVWMLGNADAALGLLRTRREFGDIVGAMTVYAHTKLVLLVAVAVVLLVALRASFIALRARYPRRINIVGALLLLYVLGFVLLASVARGDGSKFLLNDMMLVTARMAAAAVIFVTAYLAWSGFAERVLTLRYTCGVLVIYACYFLVTSAPFGTAWPPALNSAGALLARMSTLDAVLTLAPLLLPLMGSMLAPWSFNRIRHA